MNGSIEMLRLEVASDRAAFEARADELEALELSATTEDENVLARAAVALHHAYGAIESALARIAKVLETQPSGASWHRALLETMAMEVPGVRPAVLSVGALPALRDLLAFRHFFRHAYAVPLDAAKLSRLRDRVVDVRAVLAEDFERMDRWLAELAKSS